MSEEPLYQEFDPQPEQPKVIGWMGHSGTYWPVTDPADNP